MSQLQLPALWLGQPIPPAFIAAVKIMEGCKLTAYQDSGDVWTIGYGHTSGVHEGYTISQADAETLLQHDLHLAASVVVSLVKVPVTLWQFVALLDFVFNLGRAHLEGSTLLALLNANNAIAAGDELVRWKFDNGKPLGGLAKRRGQDFIWWWS